MTKKQFVIETLWLLEKKRDLAKELKHFVELNILDNDAVNWIVELLRHMAMYIKDSKSKKHILQIADTLENMKNMELQETIQDTKDAENLLLSL